MNKILTIIIPTYNMEKYLRKCLDSLIVSEENMQRLEVLVINDGSKDASSQIAHEFEAKYPQTFRVIDKENGNYGSCINRGLKEATGKYIKVLDADDYFDTHVLDEYIIFLRNKNVDLILTDYNVVNENYELQMQRNFSRSIAQNRQVFNFKEYFKKNGGQVFQMHAITYSTEMLKSMHYKQTEGISYTDQEWSTIPITKVCTAAYYNAALYQYLIGREGQTMINYLEVANPKQQFEVILNLSSFYQAQRYEEIYDSYVRQKLLKLLRSIYDGCIKFSYISEEELRHYDELLKKHTRAYQLAGTLKFFNTIPYVSYWRSSSKLKKTIFVKIPIKVKNVLGI